MGTATGAQCYPLLYLCIMKNKPELRVLLQRQTLDLHCYKKAARRMDRD